MTERWIPMYINTVIANRSHQKIDADYWNALWNLVITQADHNTAGVEYIMGEFSAFEVIVDQFMEMIDNLFDTIDIDEDVSTQDVPGSTVKEGTIYDGPSAYDEDSLPINFEGTSYVLPKNVTERGIIYGEVDSSGNPVFTTYPCAVLFEPSPNGTIVKLLTPEAGDYHVEFEIIGSNQINEDALPENYQGLVDINGQIISDRLPDVYDNLFDSNGIIRANRLPSAAKTTDPYPIGAVYISVSNTYPGSLFGGKWVQLKDKFLLAAGDSSDSLFALKADNDISSNSVKVYVWKRVSEESLIPYPYVQTTQTAGGITFTDLGDGRIKLNGTVTGYGALMTLTGLNSFDTLHLDEGDYEIVGPGHSGVSYAFVNADNFDDSFSVTEDMQYSVGPGGINLGISLVCALNTVLNNVIVLPHISRL